MALKKVQLTPSTGVSDGQFEQKFADSQHLHERARQVLAAGVSHDSRQLKPFPVYVESADGVYKWDVAGNQFIDYWMGHGALLFGHNFPPVVEALLQQATRGTHYGAPHELEVRWAELVCELIPSAERVRFTSSGSEATLLAMRLARAYTGSSLIVKLDGHFHGWHDEAMAHFVSVNTAGLNPGVEEHVALVSPFSLDPVLEILEEEPVAAVILEPGGGASGALPWSRDFLQVLREATTAHNCLLIFDEVISGFRYSPGGVQQLSGVMPDITVLAKILSGGLPGGAIAGRREVMDVFGTGVQFAERLARIPHMGTFNGNPISAAAGIATLERIGDGVAQEKAIAATTRLVELVNQAAEANRVDVRVFSNSSTYHFLIGANSAGEEMDPAAAAVILLYNAHPERYEMLRGALLLEGVDTHPGHGWVSAIHDDSIVEATAGAFDRAFQRLRREAGFAL